jgi:hypothetical protein
VHALDRYGDIGQFAAAGRIIELLAHIAPGRHGHGGGSASAARSTHARLIGAAGVIDRTLRWVVAGAMESLVSALGAHLCVSRLVWPPPRYYPVPNNAPTAIFIAIQSTRANGSSRFEAKKLRNIIMIWRRASPPGHRPIYSPVASRACHPDAGTGYSSSSLPRSLACSLAASL